MSLRGLKGLLPIGASSLIAGLPVFFVACDYFSVDKTKLVTGSFIGFWIVLGAMGCVGRRFILHWRPLTFISYLGFLALYYLNWAMWPKGTELDELMWAYSVAWGIVPFVFGSLFERRDLRVFLLVVTWWGTLLGGLVLSNYVVIEDPRLGIGRFTVGTTLNPISQSLVIGFAVIALYAQVLMKKRYYFFAIIAPLLFSILLGGSRGPAIALIIALAVMTFPAQQISRRTVITFFLLAASFGAGIVYLPELVHERYFSAERWLMTRTEEGVPLRIERAAVAIEHWQKHPIFGSGTSGNKKVYYSHNLVVQLLMETGVVGLALFLGVLISPLLNFIRTFKKGGRNVEVLGFAGFLVYVLIEAQVTGTYMGMHFLWIAMGILIAWPQIVAPAQSQLAQRWRYAGGCQRTPSVMTPRHG